MGKGINKVKISEVPEVAELVEFDNKYRDQLSLLRNLMEERSILFEAAEKAVRARGVSCGPFELISQTDKINWEKLYEYFGRKLFMDLLDGKINKVVKFSGDTNKAKAAAIRKEIPEEVWQDAHTQISRYRKEDW